MKVRSLTLAPIFFILILFVSNSRLHSQSDKTNYDNYEQEVSSNGKFISNSVLTNGRVSSDNGIYFCTYSVKEASDEIRILSNFNFYERGNLLFSLDSAPGSDLYISNSGYIAFIDHQFHFIAGSKIIFKDKYGRDIISKDFNGASLFGFSPAGNKFGVGAEGGFYSISIPENSVSVFKSAHQFAYSENEEYLALVSQNSISVYKKGKIILSQKTGLDYSRRVVVSDLNDCAAVIGRNKLIAYSLSGNQQLFTAETDGNQTFRDLEISDAKIFTGVHQKSVGLSEGILNIYSLDGRLISSVVQSVDYLPSPVEFNNSKTKNGDPIPWMFQPYDQMPTVWNYYEQHMGGYGDSYSYLHQGLDIITPIGEPVYASEWGIVKCVLTIGGAVYWRIAVSGVQTEDYSDGWLYAHLIESTIQYDVGDTVNVHDYLGDIVEWTDEWGHIHFANIRDQGLVWRYDDDEWGINFNPLTVLTPDTDSIPPVFENVFQNSRFAFCRNETSDYLDADNLHGEIDIIFKAKDYIGQSEWTQPAYKAYYWVKKTGNGLMVFPRTPGYVLNHSYPFYSGDYYEPYATTLYKRDTYLFPSSWMDEVRDFHHILTNNNGDEIVDPEEKELAFNTAEYSDGDYTIFVEIQDEFGNTAVDSMNVKFINGIVSVEEEKAPVDFYLGECYPNPFNPATRIDFGIPEKTFIELNIFDIKGSRIRTLVSNEFNPGKYSVTWDGKNDCGFQVPSGIYLIHLRNNESSITKKAILLK